MTPEVKVGMKVVDADGKRLGRVTRCDGWGFQVERGFFGPSEWVVLWEELMSVEDGTVRVARSDRTLAELAAGRLPRVWQLERAWAGDGRS